MIVKSPEQHIAIFPGSFDPFTLGHLNIVERGLQMFDKIVIAVGVNSAKKETTPVKQRIEAIARATSEMTGVEVTSYDGLTVDAARACGAKTILRGVRSVADFEYERNLADLNRAIAGIDTAIICADPALAAISSSAVRELKYYGHDISGFIP